MGCTGSRFAKYFAFSELRGEIGGAQRAELAQIPVLGD
jgi:hypothetical protein